MRTVTPLTCTWKGLTFTVIRMTDQGGYDWVQHVYPGRDGVELEPMGARARVYRLEVLFFGSEWWNDLQAFGSAVDQPGEPSEFVHPFWGSVMGVVTDMEAVHEDRKNDQARCTCTLVEGVAAPFAFATSTSMASASAAATAAASSASSAVAGLPT